MIFIFFFLVGSSCTESMCKLPPEVVMRNRGFGMSYFTLRAVKTENSHVSTSVETSYCIYNADLEYAAQRTREELGDQFEIFVRCWPCFGAHLLVLGLIICVMVTSPCWLFVGYLCCQVILTQPAAQRLNFDDDDLPAVGSKKEK